MKLKPVDSLPLETVTTTVTETVVTRTVELPLEPRTTNIDYSARKHPLARCEDCTLRPDVYVPSSGPIPARVVIVGEAPGAAEAKGGIPFSGPSGKLLDTVLAHHKINRATDCFVTNVVLCRPPANRTPSKVEIDCCSERLQNEIDAVHPNSILALGNTAASAVMDTKTKITQLRAGPPKESRRFPGVAIVPSIHPAACLRATDHFPSLVSDVGKVNVNREASQRTTIGWEPPAFRAFIEPDQAFLALQELSESRYRNLVIDIETAYDKDSHYVHPHHYRLLCVGISYRFGSAIVISETALRDSRVRDMLASLLESRDITCHNGKFDLQGTHALAPTARLHSDTMLYSYTEDERQGTHGLEYLCVEKLGAPRWKYMSNHKTFADTPTDDLHHYNAIDCSNTFGLKDLYESTLSEDSKRLHKFLVRCSNALLPVELEGLKVDQPYLKVLEQKYRESLGEIETKLTRWVANPRSNPQVAEALRQLGVPFVKTTDADFLKELLARPRTQPELREFCELMLTQRSEQKTYGTYVKGIERRLFEGRVYPTFLLHGTTTGRPSCRNPNLFNITRGSFLRKLYVAEEGNVFVQCDYCLVPETKILKSDLTWEPAGDLRVGDRLIGFGDKIGVGTGYQASTLKESKVVSTTRLIRPCYRIVTNKGEVVASAEHKWVSSKQYDSGRGMRQWVETKNLRVGELISYYIKPWEVQTGQDAGYLAGFFDGEGSLSQNACFAQNAGPVLDKVLGLLSQYEFDPRPQTNNQNPKCKKFFLAGQGAAMRFIGMFRPVRFLPKSRELWDGRRPWGKNTTPATILNIEYIGEQEVVAVGTETNTLIANGFLSHNSQVEARVVTCEAQEPYFAEIFRDPNRDIHQEVADRLGITRQRAKMVVYGLSYEMSANGLAFRLGIPLGEASRYVKEFHHVIPQIVRWKEVVKRRVLHEHEDLVTPFGRHRRFWLITADNREDIIKEAIAFYPQSIASDICMSALCQLVEDGLKVRLSVYDSIMVECPEADAVAVGQHMEARMLEAGRAYSEFVPFVVDTKFGKAWGDFG